MRVPNSKPNPFIQEPKRLKSSEQLGADPRDVELKNMKGQGTQTSRPLPPIPQSPTRSDGRTLNPSIPTRPGIPARDSSLPPSSSMHAQVPGTPRPPSPAGSSSSSPSATSSHSSASSEVPKSPHPPAHQMLRHVRHLRNQEKNYMAAAPVHSEAHRLHKKNVDYFRTYEKHLEYQRGPAISREQKMIDSQARTEKAETSAYRALYKRADKEIAKAGKKLPQLEARKAALEHQMKVLGAQSKGDVGPVKLSERITNKGQVKKEAAFDMGSPGKGILGFFNRSKRLDRLSPEELQNKLWKVKGEMAQVKLEVKHLEGEKARIGVPSHNPPQYDEIKLPSREEILKRVHESQPLRRRPWKDPLPSPSAPAESAPNLRSAMRPFGPLPDPSGKRVRFEDTVENRPAVLQPPRPRTPELAPGFEPSHQTRQAIGESIERPRNPISTTFDRAEDEADLQQMRARLARLRGEAP